MSVSEGTEIALSYYHSRSSSAWVFLFRESLKPRLYNEFMPLSAYNRQGVFYYTKHDLKNLELFQKISNSQGEFMYY